MDPDRREVVVSLIIPAYNEAELLPRLLDTVDESRRRFHRGPEAVAVIVADNRSTEATAAIAREGSIKLGLPASCICESIRKLPEVATFSPSSIPARIIALSRKMGPSVTERISKRPGSVST